MFGLLLFAVVLYSMLIGVFIFGFVKLAPFLVQEIPPRTQFSVLVTFRNEASQLPKLLNSLARIDYPPQLFEIIFINDNSTDAFEEVITSFQKQYPTIKLKLLHSEGNSKSPKKEALQLGIDQAQFDYIITTDADCVVPIQWLSGFNQAVIQNNSVFIAGPVVYENEQSFLGQFQQLNLLSLIGATIGSFGLKAPMFCNGANLCFNKNTFNQLEGYEGNETIASGDDVFLLEKMKARYSSQIAYLKSPQLAVQTSAEKSWTSFLNQQLRWASKTTAYKNRITKLVGLLVLLANLSLLLAVVFVCFDANYIAETVVIFILKVGVDSILIFKTAKLFQRKISIPYYMVSTLLYPVFSVLAGLASLFKKYTWKGRVFSK